MVEQVELEKREMRERNGFRKKRDKRNATFPSDPLVIMLKKIILFRRGHSYVPKPNELLYAHTPKWRRHRDRPSESWDFRR